MTSLEPRTSRLLVLTGWALVLALLTSTTGCATRFSAAKIRKEIVAQSGEDPRGVFEVNIGQFTTLLLKRALGDAAGETPLAGLEGLEIAVFEASGQSGPAIDVTRIKVRGWETILRTHGENRSGMLLLRPKGEDVGDLVVVGAGRKKVVYGRLRGRLDPDLPAAIGEVLEQGDPDDVRRMLTGFAESGSGD